MHTFQIFSALILLVAVFGYLNQRFVKLPDAIGMAAIGTLVSVAAIALAHFDTSLADRMRVTVAAVDFSEIMLHSLLGLLLFAGSLEVDLAQVRKEKWLILGLATFGVLMSTVLVGMAFFLVSRWLSLGVPLVYCLLFGALISPTDPVAVLSALRQVGVPTSLEARIAGESLFNDGTAVVAYLTLLGLASGNASITVASTLQLFATEVLGAIAFGLAVGYVAFRMLRRVDSYSVEILITLALATAGYAAAEAAGVSAPIAVVLMGLMVGDRGRREAMSAETRQRLFGFWQVLDELLNLLLFGFIGLEMMTVSFSAVQAGAGLAGIAIVLLARLASVGAPVWLTPRLRKYQRPATVIMTWGGLRGGISIALALSLPEFPGRAAVISTTYAVVIFSILVQATSLQRIARRVLPPAPGPGASQADTADQAARPGR